MCEAKRRKKVSFVMKQESDEGREKGQWKIREGGNRETKDKGREVSTRRRGRTFAASFHVWSPTA